MENLKYAFDLFGTFAACIDLLHKARVADKIDDAEFVKQVGESITCLTTDLTNLTNLIEGLSAEQS